MKHGVVLLAVAALLVVLVYLYGGTPGPVPEDAALAVAEQENGSSADTLQPGAAATRGVFDISVHSVEELEVLFDRAEELARRPNPVPSLIGLPGWMHFTWWTLRFARP
jgi:hypothetical protein